MVNPASDFYFVWLMIISTAILYNTVSLAVRSTFEEVQVKPRVIWFVLDYVSDLLYLVDMFIHSRKGSSWSNCVRFLKF